MKNMESNLESGDVTDIARKLKDINMSTEGCSTNDIINALKIIVNNGNQSDLLILFDAGLDPNLHFNRIGETTIMESFKNSNCVKESTRSDKNRCADLLMAYGVSINSGDKNGNTALLNACNSGDLPHIRFLTQCGADPNITNKYGVSPLAVASSKGYSSCVNHLIQAGASVDFYSARHGYTALHEAVYYGHLETVKILSGYVADINKPNMDDKTALILSVDKGWVDCLKVLLLHPEIQIDLSDGYGKTALMWAAKIGNSQCLVSLLEAGCDPNLEDRSGVTAIEMALRAQRDQCVLYLLKYGSRVVHVPIYRTEALLELEISKRENLQSMHFLYAAGCVLGRSETIKQNSLLLSKICRDIIRSQVMRMNYNSNLYFQVQRLPIPGAIKKFLVMDLDLDQYSIPFSS